MSSRARSENKTPDFNNNFACGLCLSIIALTATMCLYNVCRGNEWIRRKKAKKHQYPTFPDQYLPTPLECSENLWCNKIFTLVPRLNPSLGFVTWQEIQNTKNKNKKRRRNLDSGAFRPRVKIASYCYCYCSLTNGIRKRVRRAKLCWKIMPSC